MPDSRVRQTAFKIWISNLMSGKYVVQEGWNPNYIQVDEKKISRVNIIANVVETFTNQDGSFSTITLDDGSDTIRAKTWREDAALLQDIKIGDMVLVIGRSKEYNDEIYLIPEIIKKVDDPNWELVRKLELIKNLGKPKIETTQIEEPKELPAEIEKPEIKPVEEKEKITEEVVEDVTETSRQKILNLIEKSGEEAEKISIIQKVV